MSTSLVPLSQAAWIALGANLGEPLNTFRAVLRLLTAWSPHPLRVSSVWQTPPVHCPAGSPPFFNAVVMLIPGPTETPESLLERLLSLERSFGRQPSSVRNAPRPLDLDLVAFGQEQRHTETLTLPHPRAHLRRFVLQPLSELAPNLILPGQSLTVTQLLEQLPPLPGMHRVGTLEPSE